MIAHEQVLNQRQLEAVTTLNGPLLVIAGAGSGKTRTLIYRVAHLVEKGVEPASILLLTFTRKAAHEMLERAAMLSDPRCRNVSGGTFHSLAHRVLRLYGGRLGFSNGFTVMDRSDMEEILHSLLGDLHLPKGAFKVPKRRTLASILSKAANLESDVEELVALEYPQFIAFSPYVKELSRLYTSYKKKNRLMDYDDLILNLRALLVEDLEVRKRLAEQYQYIMVDEYQDTNRIQAQIVKWLGHEHRNIMVVGDDSQAIYSFRGADYRNMFDFPKEFPDAKIIRLEENYRSTQPILDFTNAIMERAQERYTKCLFTKREGGRPPRVVDTRTEPEQALFVCRTIQEMLNRGRRLRDVAVLFRAAYHSFELELELTRAGIRYVKYGGFRFMESAHIKDLLAYFRAVLNRDDAVSWGRILRLIPGIGRAKSHSIIEWMRGQDIPPSRLGEWPGRLPGRSREAFLGLARLLSGLCTKSIEPREAVELAMSYYVPFLEEMYDDHPRRRKDLEQLAAMASRYKGLRRFVDELVLEPPTSSADIALEASDDFLTLSTVHSAKGLEWPVVFIIWVMEGRFPSARALGDPLAVEEERRLMYVAATRAKDELILCYPGQEQARPWQSEGLFFGGRENGLSSFVSGLPGTVVSYENSGGMVLNNWGDRGENSSGAGVEEMEQDEDPVLGTGSGLKAGDKVEHPAFGVGVVSRVVEGEKVEVLFRDAGRKLLHLAYTTLIKV